MSKKSTPPNTGALCRTTRSDVATASLSSAAVAVAGDSADDNDAVAPPDLVVRQKDPAFGGVDFFDIWRIHDTGT